MSNDPVDLGPPVLDSVERGAVAVLEHFLGRYYEGPDLPVRIIDVVRVFQLMHPVATPAEWVDFAILHARSAWQQGYVRGAEWRERREAGEPELLPEEERSLFDDPELAAQLAHLAACDPVGAGVPGAVEALAQVGEATGSFRVVVDARGSR